MSHSFRFNPRIAALGVAALACAAVASAQTAAPAPSQPQPQAQPAPAAPAPAARPAPAPIRAQPAPPHAEAVFEAWDTDHNGSLSRAEFDAGIARLRGAAAQPMQARLRQQFDHVDANHNGGIDRTEYPNLMLVGKAGSAAPAFSEFDKDGSQKLEFGEYIELVKRLAPARPAPKP